MRKTSDGFRAAIKTFFLEGLGPASDFNYIMIENNNDIATIDMPYSEKLAIDKKTGIIHTAVLTTLVDTTLGLSVALKSQSTRPIATVDLRVDFLRNNTPYHDFRSNCSCHLIDGDLAFAEGSVIDKRTGDILVKAMGTFMLGTKGPDFSTPFNNHENATACV